jgi:hypothetical protein
MKSYRAEVIVSEASYRSVPYATPDRAASALPRLLSCQFWQERLARTKPLAKWSVGIVEEEGPAHELEPLGVDLAQFAEGLRRRLYDQAVADHFSPHPASARERVNPWPPYSPEEARLEILFLGGRWLATWKRLELEGGNEEERTELLRIYSTERGITYYEV